MVSGSIILIVTLLLIFVGAIIGGFVAHRFRFPSILGYIVAGILLGNLFPSFSEKTFLTTVSDIGVTLLLFTLGVEFSFKRLKHVLPIVGWAAILQIGLFFGIMYAALLVFGYPLLFSLFLAAVASFSSTAVVMKILTERGEVDTVPGDILTAWLIVQDLSVIVFMIVLPSVVNLYTGGASDLWSVATAIGGSILKSAIVIAVILFFGRHGFPRFLTFIASLKSRELLVTSTVGLVFLSAVTCAAFGLSPSLGAFIAGLLVAETSENHAIFAEVRPLRDLFLVIFFVTIGMMLPYADVARMIGPILLISLFALLLKWGISFSIMRFFRFHRKTSFIVSLGLLPLSEFGFLLAKEGKLTGALTTNEYTMIVAIVFVSIIAGSPLLSDAHHLYQIFRKYIGNHLPLFFPEKIEEGEHHQELPLENHVVICGYGRVGKYVGRALFMAGIPFVVVEYNHAIVADLRAKEIPVFFGDPADLEVLDHAEVDHARAVVIAIPDQHTQELVIANVQTLNKGVRIICRSHHEEDQVRLKTMGVSVIVQPEFEAALKITEKLLSDFGISAEDREGKISRLKIEHGMG